MAVLLDEVGHVAEHRGTETAEDVDVIVAVDVGEVAAGALVHHHLVHQFLRLRFEAGDHTRVGHPLAVFLREGLALRGLRGIALHEGIEPRALLRRHVVHLLLHDPRLSTEDLLQFGCVFECVGGGLLGPMIFGPYTSRATTVPMGQNVIRQLVQIRHLFVKLAERDLHPELLGERGRDLCQE